MKKSKRRIGFFGIIIRDFLIFAVTVFVLLILIYIVGLIVMFFNPATYYYIPIEATKEDFINEEFDEFGKRKILGKNGFFVVYDENNQIKYSSESAEKLDLTDNQISLIPDSKYNIVESEYIGADKVKYTSVIYKIGNEMKSNLIVDENLKVLITDNIGLKNRRITEFEFKLLTGKYDGKYEISKMNYVGKDNENYTAIFCKDLIDITNYIASIQEIFKYVSYAYLLFFIIAILLFLLNLERKVKKPLVLLSAAIERLSEGKTNKPIEYKGPREFEEICKSFNNMADKLRKAEKERIIIEEEKQKMLADISHDLKTPITVIQGFAKAISDDKVKEEELKDYLDTIYIKANSLAELINSFSEFSKIERPDFSLVPKKIDICELSRNYFIDKYNELELMGFDLDIEIPDTAIYCMIDEFQMKRVFENIISNTIKYNSTGTLVSFCLKRIDTDCIIHIGDNGLGIPDELKDTIFKPFSMGDTARGEGKGSGLGMAIAEKIITSHNANISLLDKPVNQLTAVYEIKLPIVD